MTFKVVVCCWCIALSVTIIRSEVNQYCDSREFNASQSAIVPELPELPTAYTTHIECNFKNPRGQRTVNSEEWYDEANNFGKVTLTSDTKVNTLYYDYATGQLVTLEQDKEGFHQTCVVSNLTNSYYGFIYGRQSGSPGRIYSAKDAFRFGKQFNETYMGKADIRGIKTNHWRSCQHSDPLRAAFTMDYYFSADDWTTSSFVSVPVPVRLVVQGNATDSVGYSFTNTYDFVNFKQYPFSPSSGFLRSPEGVYCPGRAKTKPLPRIPDTLAWTQETSIPIQGVSTVTDVWYDYKNKLTKIVTKPSHPAEPFYTTELMSEVNDFSTGVAYIRDLSQGNCTMQSIIGSADYTLVLGSNITGIKNPVQLKIKSPQEMFLLTEDYYYEGTKMVRGMLCDVYISKQTIKYNQYNIGLVVEVYFSSDGWAGYNTHGISSSTKVPVQYTTHLAIPFNNTWYRSVSSFYNFGHDTIDPSVFDVSSCFPEEQQTHFMIKFIGSQPALAKDFAELARDQITDIIRKAIPFTSLRIQSIQILSPLIHGNTSVFHMIGTLVERVPDLSHYSLIGPEDPPPASDLTLGHVASLSDCAGFCERYPVVCNSFDYCATTKMCLLNKHHLHAGNNFTRNINGTCQHWSRVVEASHVVIPDPTLAELMRRLTNLVYQGDLSILLSGVGGNVVQFNATSIRRDIYRNNARTSTGESMAQFKRAAHHVFLTEFRSDRISGLSVAECASRCLIESTFDCQSFDYCYATGHCYMTDIHPSNRPDLLKKDTSCDLFSRNYISKFTTLPGKVISTKSDKAVADVATAEQCALQCILYPDFLCKSFDWCESKKACVLGKKHILDLPDPIAAVSVPDCTHYSRKFFDDFKLTWSNVVTKFEDGYVFINTSLTACAKVCVEELASDCKDFNFCDVATEPKCFIKSLALKKRSAGYVIAEKIEHCSLYTRAYFPNGRPVAPKNNIQLTTISQNSGVSSGAVAGIAVSCLIVGLLLGALALYLVYRRRAPGSELSMQPIVNPNYESEPSS